MYTPVVMDGIIYKVRIKADPALEESFRIEDGENAGSMLSGRERRDVIGTYYDHTLSVEPVPGEYQDYEAFYLAISAPVDSHTITMPHGQSTITYQAKVISGSHRKRNKISGVTHYTGLQVQFQALAPQRRPEY